MPVHTLDDENALYYEYTQPTRSDGYTYVFFNALTGDVGMWNNSVVSALTDAGHGVLLYNMRGQAQSPYSADLSLDQHLIVNDAVALLAEVNPPRPVFVGLSIGGIFAAWAINQGASCEGLVLLNTLRRDGPRLRWINDAVVRMSEFGGPLLMRDIMSPLIMNEDWLAENRDGCLQDAAYEPLPTDSGTYNLLSSARSTDWDFPYEKLSQPVLVITGRHDRVFRDPADIETLTARIPSVQSMEFENAGHMIPVEQPARLCEALLAFPG
ncbi:MAG: alpha/beta hydrolase [Gammaproteobacteria bacterium]|nr:alpha/beta hydrolase [Gammaproteobacteria bacterium]